MGSRNKRCILPELVPIGMENDGRGSIQIQAVESTEGYAYIKIDITTLPERRREYIKHLKTFVEKHICNRHRKQMKNRLNNVKGSRRPILNREVEKPVFLSSLKVAHILGYKSHSAAMDKREKYYPMSNEKSILIKKTSSNGGVAFRFSCRKVIL